MEECRWRVWVEWVYVVKREGIRIKKEKKRRERMKKCLFRRCTTITSYGIGHGVESGLWGKEAPRIGFGLFTYGLSSFALPPFFFFFFLAT